MKHDGDPYPHREIHLDKIHLDNSEKAYKMTFRDPNPLAVFYRKPKMKIPQETKHERQNCDIFIPR